MVNWSYGRLRLKAPMTQSRYRQMLGRKRVGAVAGRIGIAGQVEPHPRPALAVGRVVEEPVDGPLVGVGGLIAGRIARLPRASAAGRGDRG